MRDLFWVPVYSSYYCNTCMKYPDLAEPESPPPPSTYTLRAAPLTSPPRYSPEQIVTMFRQLKEHYEKGVKSEEEYGHLLEVFKFMDEYGRYWTIGAQSGVWYYHDGENWVQARAEPPPFLDLADLG
jgi:hypothetical protein